jgi:hypothetical protein
MNNTKLTVLLIAIAIVVIVPFFFLVPQTLNNKNVTSNSTVNDNHENHNSHVLFATANPNEKPVEVAHFFNSRVRAGDALGDVRSFIVDENYVDADHNCEFCTRFEYTPGDTGIAGFAYMDEKGFDLTNAKRVAFYVTGLSGDAEIKFMVAGKDSNTNMSDTGIFKNQKFAKTTKSFSLSKFAQVIQIDVSNTDLKDITYPFALEITKGKDPGKIIFYVNMVFYDTKTAYNPVPTDSN